MFAKTKWSTRFCFELKLCCNVNSLYSVSSVIAFGYGNFVLERPYYRTIKETQVIANAAKIIMTD